MASSHLRRWLPLVAGFVAGILGCWLVDTVWADDPPPRSAALEPVRLTPHLHAETWLKRLEADEVSDRKAKEYIRELTDLRYEYVIPYLIANLDKSYGEPGQYPCKTALKEFGTAALAPVVDVVLYERDPRRRRMLMDSVVWDDTTRKTAYFYVHGLLGKYGDKAEFIPEAVKNLTEWVSGYEPEADRRYAPPKKEMSDRIE